MRICREVNLRNCTFGQLSISDARSSLRSAVRRNLILTVRPTHSASNTSTSHSRSRPRILLSSISQINTLTTMAPATLSSSSKLRPVVVSGPSGTGKSTLLHRLVSAHPNTFGYSGLHTAGQPRPCEQDGQRYNFVSREAFKKLKAEGGFIETAEFGV